MFLLYVLILNLTIDGVVALAVTRPASNSSECCGIKPHMVQLCVIHCVCCFGDVMILISFQNIF